MTDDLPRDIAGVRRWLRDEEIRRGKRRPRTHRETEIWLAGLAERFPPRVDREAEGVCDRSNTKKGEGFSRENPKKADES